MNSAGAARLKPRNIKEEAAYAVSFFVFSEQKAPSKHIFLLQVPRKTPHSRHPELDSGAAFLTSKTVFLIKFPHFHYFSAMFRPQILFILYVKNGKNLHCRPLHTNVFYYIWRQLRKGPSLGLNHSNNKKRSKNGNRYPSFPLW
ncbi:MAG: hypothetical protein MJY87_06810 [Fibrobacter sp.]|nr:hypothetical protein [Fibrobacter sp.]